MLHGPEGPLFCTMEGGILVSAGGTGPIKGVWGILPQRTFKMEAPKCYFQHKIDEICFRKINLEHACKCENAAAVFIAYNIVIEIIFNIFNLKHTVYISQY